MRLVQLERYDVGKVKQDFRCVTYEHDARPVQTRVQKLGGYFADLECDPEGPPRRRRDGVKDAHVFRVVEMKTNVQQGVWNESSVDHVDFDRAFARDLS